MELNVFPQDINIELFGHTVAVRETYLAALILIAIIVITALIIRIFIFPKFTTDIKKIGKTQLVFEFIFKKLDQFTKGAVGHLGEKLSPYILAVGFYLIFSGLVELIGMRTPLSDLSTTVAFGLSTFVLINYYGIKEKGVAGRFKSYLKPNPINAPFKLISDIATPISLSCRLFGNLLGGYIVMELIYGVLENLTEKYAVYILPAAIAAALPGILSLYFTLFHVVIQFYIFSMLSLTFINEAAETTE